MSCLAMELRSDSLRYVACRKGTSAIEFAIVLPVFVMLLFGIISYGAYLTVVHSVQQLAAEATRAGVAGLSDSERTSLANSNIAANVASYPLISAKKLTITSAATDAATSTFSVTLNYDASGMVVFTLPSFVPSPPTTVVRSAAIQRGGY
jgi:Flp pilus assembly protein TadG